MVAYPRAFRTRFQTVLSPDNQPKLNRPSNAITLSSIKWSANDDIADVGNDTCNRWLRRPAGTKLNGINKCQIDNGQEQIFVIGSSRPILLKTVDTVPAPYPFLIPISSTRKIVVVTDGAHNRTFRERTAPLNSANLHGHNQANLSAT
jgi:hypothetical protein